MQPRRISRELALLSASQVPSNLQKLEQQELKDLVVAAVRTLSGEIRDTLEVASSELERGNSLLLSSETRSSDLITAKAMVVEAIEATQSAINRLGNSVEIPELLQGANLKDVREYTLYILTDMLKKRQEIDQYLNDSMVDWTMGRLARIDQDILRIAVTEMKYLELDPKVAINEAVELAKRYSEHDGHRFINGVLRRVSDRLSAK
ncbi:MAG: transcription antitermination factor NusB [Cyanobacteria bacterium P01_F01_bin.150]